MFVEYGTLKSFPSYSICHSLAGNTRDLDMSSCRRSWPIIPANPLQSDRARNLWKILRSAVWLEIVKLKVAVPFTIWGVAPATFILVLVGCKAMFAGTRESKINDLEAPVSIKNW